VPFGDVGRHFVRDIQIRQAAREQGVELGAYFGLQAIDDYTSGLQPTELLICGGEPGVGKSAVWWRGALNFAERQASAPREAVGTLILSLEMSPTPSSARFASMLGAQRRTDCARVASPRASSQRSSGVARAREVPLWLNYAPTLRASQLRAVISEAIRRHNVGLVVIDHFRMWDLDRGCRTRTTRTRRRCASSRSRSRRLAERRGGLPGPHAQARPGSNGRPKMSDLRGSYQVAAHSDFVSFIYRPAMYATRRRWTRETSVTLTRK
jgi:replicative DNA helicase